MKLKQDSHQRSPDSCSDDLQNIVLALLGSHLRSFTINFLEVGLVLRGSCDSFHAKQMAQETVAKNTSLRIAANDLVVNESRSRSTSTSCVGDRAPDSLSSNT